VSSVPDPVSDIARMLRAFVQCEMYGIVDRLANATSREAVEAALYEALRAARAAKMHQGLCERVKADAVWIAGEGSVFKLLEELDRDLVSGLELVRKIVLRALAM